SAPTARSLRPSFEATAERAQRLIEAEAAYRRALAIDPTAVEAHLRRGRVLLDLGRAPEAGPEFEWVGAHSPPDDLRYLAVLFRGLAEERARNWAAAGALFREAQRIGPKGARAAAIALAHARDRSGDPEGAQSVLATMLAGPASHDPFDVYLFGPSGEEDRLLGRLQKEAVRPARP
ncbi:MAG TPA: tetratricopeptide repeat protein, partial [Vicinamibacteria bacterium]|nr:tetratricopeptide repeat protein [Vicinamibacteria bacterium]